MLRDCSGDWTVSDASQLYDVDHWGNGYFSLSPTGTLLVHPERNANRSIDVYSLMRRLEDGGTELPVLLRFNGILKDRMDEIHDVFAAAIEEHAYQNNFACIYPIKVNQQRQVVEQIVESGLERSSGLEAGSKPELLAVMAMSRPDTPIVCNGCKDVDFIETAMWASKMGRTVFLVIEKTGELESILEVADRLGVQPRFGIRVKLAARGAGRWQSSGGYGSKFGLTVSEMLTVVHHLQDIGMLDCLQLLHFHLGSQITDIHRINTAVIEASRIYADLVNRGVPLQYLDVGGGLGVDYNGSQSNFDSSVNYTLREYANSLVYHIASVCRDAGAPHPYIFSECGRALVAYHTMLVFGVVGVSTPGGNHPLPTPALANLGTAEPPVRLLCETLDTIHSDNLIESFHDAQLALESVISLFSLGHMSLDQRASGEQLFWLVCRRIQDKLVDVTEIPEELEGLDCLLSEVYFCNFSIFQSMPDSWTIKQLFPVLPIHRLNERPEHHAVLGDITCDSDGKIDKFIDHRGVCKTLLLHEFDGSPYLLCTTLLGAYQETLGDLHNLLGSTNRVDVDLSDDGEVALETFVEGNTMSQVLEFFQFKKSDLLSRIAGEMETTVGDGLLSNEEAGSLLRFYEDALNSYTYLTRTSDCSSQTSAHHRIKDFATNVETDR